MLRIKIKTLIKKSILEAQKQKHLPFFVIPEIEIEHPQDPKFGDYATNIAMKIVRLAGMRPMEIGELLVDKLKSYKAMQECCEKIELAKPGFINFALRQEFFASQIKEIIKKGNKFGKLGMGYGKKVQVEFISANPTGPLTIGNGRGGFVGDTLANVLTWAGYNVKREYYWNDAKISALIIGLGKSVKGQEIVYAGDYIKTLPNKIKRKYQKDIKKISTQEAGWFASKILKEEIKKVIEKKLKIKFDRWFSEQSLYNSSAINKILELLEEKKLIYEKEGAVWFCAKDYGDDQDRVLVRFDGRPTYLLSDIAYHKNKFERDFDKVIDIWGADHAGYVKRLQGAMVAIGFPEKLDILISQLVRLIRGGKELRVSKRKGVFVTLEELIDQVGLDVARFFFLMYTLDTHMDFDLDLARKRSKKNPVFYVQYAHTRICSIIRKAKQKVNLKKVNWGLLKHPAELALIRELLRFPELIEDVACSYEIHRLPHFAISLADKFHDFYERCRVLEKDQELRKARLALISATKIVFKNVLDVLGISAPEKM